MSAGYLYLHRRLRDHPIYRNSHAVHIWLECLMRATHAPRRILIGRQYVELQVGQFVMGRKEFARCVNLSPSTVRNWLEFFRVDSMVDILHGRNFSIVTVKNWSPYQKQDSQVDSLDSKIGQPIGQPGGQPAGQPFAAPAQQEMAFADTEQDSQVDSQSDTPQDTNKNTIIYPSRKKGGVGGRKAHRVAVTEDQVASSHDLGKICKAILIRFIRKGYKCYNMDEFRTWARELGELCKRTDLEHLEFYKRELSKWDDYYDGSAKKSTVTNYKSSFKNWLLREWKISPKPA